MNENNNFVLLGFGFLLGILLKSYPSTDIVNTSAQVVLAFAALIALYQIFLSKKDIENRTKREIINLTLEQIQHFALVIEEFNKLINLQNLIVPSIIYKVELENYYKEEVESGNAPIKFYYQKNRDSYYKDPGHTQTSDIGKLMFKIANDFELFACTFIEADANKDVAFNPCAKSFCAFVEQNYSHYCFYRCKGKVNLYENTIKLYKIWSRQIEDVEKHTT